MKNADPELLCLCIEVRNAAQAPTRRYDEQLAPAGITVTQLSLLNHVTQLATPTLKALAAATGLDRSTLGRNLRLLENQGHVSITAGEDARTRVVRLTRKGRSALKKGAPLWYDIQTALASRLGRRKRALLTELLNELTAREGSTA